MENNGNNYIRRESNQALLPVEKNPATAGRYDIYPTYQLDNDKIFEGFESLSLALREHQTVIIDGYTGVFYSKFRESLDKNLKPLNINPIWTNTLDYLKAPGLIEKMIGPYLGTNDPLFGNRTSLSLEDFFDMPRMSQLIPDCEADMNIIIGPGAFLAGWEGIHIYIDIPKAEIQYRSRAGSISNLGAVHPTGQKEMYKRFYFVDWIVLNKHKKHIINNIDLFIDGQRPDNPIWMRGVDLRKAMKVMGINVFRARPWFEPGTWGGTWIKEHIDGLNKNTPNYAWSFELIVPENGLLLESSQKMLEISFDTLMFLEAQAVLGDSYSRFRDEFPIRFDYLDTFDGGNLSIQCHPGPEYIKKHFGENFTQEECYYILDTKDNADVYLGFQDDIIPEEFRTELENSYMKSKEVNIENFVQKHPSSKHDLFLIPYGTIHGSGKNNLVLEISSTPYIFTFKMYDWLRPDLDGSLRPLNIQRGMENLFFDRKGDYVGEKLIAKPILIDHGHGWELYHLATHETHLYDVHRYHFIDAISIETNKKCHVLSLVEGTSVSVETENGMTSDFSYAETFVVPAAAVSYRIINHSKNEAIVIKAFVK